jgi:hypothetical protein
MTLVGTSHETSEQGATHDLQTQLAANQLRHQVPLPMHSLSQVDLCIAEGKQMKRIDQWKAKSHD